MSTFFRSRLFDAALLATAAFFSLSAVAAYALAPKNEAEAVAVIFAPWTSAAEAFGFAVNAGGRFVRFGAFEFIAVIQPEAADYKSRVRANGAWLVADPKALAACLESVTGSR